MSDQEGFEKFWESHNVGVCVTDKNDALIGWKARQSEIDALKNELSEHQMSEFHPDWLAKHDQVVRDKAIDDVLAIPNLEKNFYSSNALDKIRKLREG